MEKHICWVILLSYLSLAGCMSEDVCPGFFDMDSLKTPFTGENAMQRCITPVLKDVYVKSIELNEDQGIFSMESYCARTYKNGGLASLSSDNWEYIYESFAKDWFGNAAFLQNLSLNQQLLRIHPGFEIPEPLKRLNGSRENGPSLHADVVLRFEAYEAGIRHSYDDIEQSVNDDNLELDWPTFNGSLITDSLGYPQCIALHLKKDSENLSWSEPFKCNDYSKWDILFCSHESYRSCSAIKGNLIGKYFVDDSGNCSSIYDVYILEHEDKPYGIPCEAKYVSEEVPCINCAGQWNQWTEWSSPCGWAYRTRFRHSVANSSDNCSMPDARCCRQWSETTKESCETYIPGTSIDLAKVNCGIGTRQVDISGRYYCRCPYGSTGPLCQIKVKCPLFPCLNGECRNESCECTSGYTGILCEKHMRHCHQFFLCQNGGHCVPSQLGYYCVCSDGYTGPSCEEKVDMCDGPNPCMNDGVCYRTAVGSRCACLLEYGGKLCDYEDLQKQRYINEILTSRVQGRTWKVVVAALTLVASCAFIYWVSRKMEAAACSEWNDSSKSSQPDVKISKPQRRKSIFSGISLETVASFVARCFRRSITDDSSTSATTKSRITGRSFFRRFAWLFGRKR